MIDSIENEVEMIGRHLDILRLVVNNEPIGIVKMSNETGYAHHQVRYSLRVLQEENLISPTNQGAMTTDRTEAFIADLDEQIDDIRARFDTLRVSGW
ncbi:hypothetical protein [Haladaptatus salinisoli]|uniref:hypothetical protein n=1 Tax=Haladaptatus salinisoli TaxID=2884876 RepID=UPI001D0AD61F|nr:hypothetical protein [Haladaptatus salinisoli]